MFLFSNGNRILGKTVDLFSSLIFTDVRLEEMEEDDDDI